MSLIEWIAPATRTFGTTLGAAFRKGKIAPRAALTVSTVRVITRVH